VNIKIYVSLCVFDHVSTGHYFKQLRLLTLTADQWILADSGNTGTRMSLAGLQVRVLDLRLEIFDRGFNPRHYAVECNFC